MVNIRKLESELWEAADLLRADSKSHHRVLYASAGPHIPTLCLQPFEFVEG